MKHQILVVLLLFSLTLAEEQSYRKVIHNTDPEAKCLDGSPAGLYVHEGGDKSSILMYFVGGGACGE